MCPSVVETLNPTPYINIPCQCMEPFLEIPETVKIVVKVLHFKSYLVIS